MIERGADAAVSSVVLSAGLFSTPCTHLHGAVVSIALLRPQFESLFVCDSVITRVIKPRGSVDNMRKKFGRVILMSPM